MSLLGIQNQELMTQVKVETQPSSNVAPRHLNAPVFVVFDFSNNSFFAFSL